MWFLFFDSNRGVVPYIRLKQDKDCSVHIFIKKNLKTFFVILELSNQTILLSDDQIAGLDENNVKTEPPMEVNICFS